MARLELLAEQAAQVMKKMDTAVYSVHVCDVHASTHAHAHAHAHALALARTHAHAHTHRS